MKPFILTPGIEVNLDRAIDEVIYLVYHHFGGKLNNRNDVKCALEMSERWNILSIEDIVRTIIVCAHRELQDKRAFKSYDW